MATATITTKGQTTIPKSVRECLHLSPGDRVEFIVQDDGTALMVPATLTLTDLKAAIPAPPRKLGLRDFEDAIHRHAAERTHRR
ncbi:MAG: type II toxin-antitoxin system PrlF family antitoxin [Rhodospirillales bacterium]|nr:type II toxin-antitoxin system PrlF family antitoxin [Rhodospirillales bacterium]